MSMNSFFFSKKVLKVNRKNKAKLTFLSTNHCILSYTDLGMSNAYSPPLATSMSHRSEYKSKIVRSSSTISICTKLNPQKSISEE